MHNTLFSLKRAHQRSLHMLRALVSRFGLTPARFDMLCAILVRQNPSRQRDLQTRLGVTAPTVSRMLKSLEDLGLVIRRKDETDRRHRIVAATPAGCDALFDAYEHAICDAKIESIVTDAVAGSLHPKAVQHALRRFDRFLSQIRSAFRDSATLLFDTVLDWMDH